MVDESEPVVVLGSLKLSESHPWGHVVCRCDGRDDSNVRQGLEFCEPWDNASVW